MKQESETSNASMTCQQGALVFQMRQTFYDVLWMFFVPALLAVLPSTVHIGFKLETVTSPTCL